MDYIFTPWREEYVRNVFKMNDCIFCRALEMDNDREAYILYRGMLNFVMLNKYPYTPGHLMIAPYKHLDSVEKATREASHELGDLLQMSLKILRANYKPHGFNAGMNIGQSAGAGIIDHYHLHIIPRWTGDSNFMPLVGKTKLFIEDLDSTYSRLSLLFEKKKAKPAK
ncbi:MAG: HIT domain-containing protein [Candidatus Aminicenantes bacterium]|jgi:ATP adenylyltransferase